jgi:hypothetical protein
MCQTFRRKPQDHQNTIGSNANLASEVVVVSDSPDFDGHRESGRTQGNALEFCATAQSEGSKTEGRTPAFVIEAS